MPHQRPLEESLQSRTDAAWLRIQAAASQGRLLEIWQQIYGPEIAQSATATALQNQLAAGVRLDLELRTLDAETIRNAYAAYAPHGSDGAETIYINSDWFAEASTEASVPLLLEEIGHALDQRLSPQSDAQGDEGEYFAKLLLEDTLRPEVIDSIRRDGDHGTLAVGSTEIAVEFGTSANSSVVYREGASTYADLFLQTSGTSVLTGLSTVFKITVGPGGSPLGGGVQKGDKLAFHLGAFNLTSFSPSASVIDLATNRPAGSALAGVGVPSGVTYQVVYDQPSKTTTIVLNLSTVSSAGRSSFKEKIAATLAFYSESRDPVHAGTNGDKRRVALFNNGANNTVTVSNTLSIIPVNDPPTLGGAVTGFQFHSAAASPAALVMPFQHASVIGPEAADRILSFSVAWGGLLDSTHEQVFIGTTLLPLDGGTHSNVSIPGVTRGGNPLDVRYSLTSSGGLYALTVSGPTSASEALTTDEATALLRGIGYQYGPNGAGLHGLRVFRFTGGHDTGGTANGGLDSTSSLDFRALVDVVPSP